MIRSFFKRAASNKWLPWLLALAGGLVYVLSAITIAHTKTSFLDEGLYLYKGFLFASGRYMPFQDYGPWTNHAPLSFLIPGYIQKWFGPGLLTARYFMILVGVSNLLGLWFLARRWGGNWWATGVIWAMALNPAEIKVHTLAISEGLIASLLIWMLVLTVGVRRPLWQTLLGAGLAGLMILTRENMIFVSPLLLLYLFWQHGRKTGLLAALCGAAVFLVGNAFFWPEILKFWAIRLPVSLTPFLASWRLPAQALGQSIPVPEEASFYRIFLYFWLTIRLHFVALVGAVAVWLLWPRRSGRPMTGRVRAAIFLSSLLLILLGAHMSAAFFGEFCVSCILLYVAYFDFIGLLLLVVAQRFLLRAVPPTRRVLVLATGALIILAVGFSTHEDLSADFANRMIFQLEDAYLWSALKHVTGLPPLLLFRTTFVTLMSLVAVLLFGLALWWARRFFSDRQAWARGIGVIGLIVLLTLGLLLSPTPVLGKGNDFFACDDSDVLASYEEAGQALSEVIPSGSTVYWEGRILAIFLYLPDVQVYPPQMNHVHSFFFGGDAETLLRYGFWNDELARRWLAEADYILVEAGELQDWEEQILETDTYLKVLSTRKVERCRWQSVISVYRRVTP